MLLIYTLYTIFDIIITYRPFFISSLHAITTHDITVIQEPRISKLEGTSDQMIRPATIAPGTERYLMGAKTTASPNLNAYVKVNCKNEPATPIVIRIKIRLKLKTGNSGVTKNKLVPKTIAPIELCQIATETGSSVFPNFRKIIDKIAPLTPLPSAR